MSAVADAAIELHPREQQILLLVAEGLDSPAIGERLFLGEGTVKEWRSRLYRKLGAHTAAQAVHHAHQAGLLDTRLADLQALTEDLALVQQAHEMGYRIALAPLAGKVAGR